MDAPEPNEPSYYEIALTSRQVLVAFVVLLSSMLVAFFSGVWVGRGGSAARPTTQIAATQSAGEEPLQELKFFSEDRRAGAPAPAAVVPPTPATIEPHPGRTLAEDVGATPAAMPTLPPAASPTLAPTASPSTAPTPVAVATAAPAAPTAVSTAPAATGFYVQVISSREEGKAKRYQQDLVRRGFKAFLSPVVRDGQKYYRVRIGPYPRREQAQAVVEKVRKTVSREAIVTDKP